jgi:hypothetical protein
MTASASLAPNDKARARRRALQTIDIGPPYSDSRINSAGKVRFLAPRTPVAGAGSSSNQNSWVETGQPREASPSSPRGFIDL